MIPGPRNLITDVAGLGVGNAQDDRLKSGVTVLTADRPFAAAVQVMGGAPGTRETDLLAPDKSVTEIDALVLAGGSAFGLDACSGVVAALRAAGRGFPAGRGIRVPIVPGAILYDLANGGAKDWHDNPYAALGAQALTAAAPDFRLGSVGAGTGALTANFKGGLGSASLILTCGTTVGALAAVNPNGCVCPPDSRHFWAAPFEIGAEFGGLGPDPRAGLIGLYPSRKAEIAGDPGNTVLAIVATDAALSKTACHRLACAAHDGIARAVVPAHTPVDGDLIFALATGTAAAAPNLKAIGAAAAHCLTRAIARAVHLATPAPGDLLPCWSES